MIEALERYLVHLEQTGDHQAAVLHAVQSIADQPWEVVRLGTQLCRSRPAIADEEIGLTRAIERTAPSSKHAVLTVRAGAPYPVPQHVRRRASGVYDAPLDLARRVVSSALEAVQGETIVGLDPACGCGGFLLAMHEAGVPEVYGTDEDPLALQVAAIAVPQARLLCESAIKHGPPVDLLVGAPPLVPAERQDIFRRKDLRRRYPSMGRRFDLTLPFVSAGAERVRPGGALGVLVPSSLLVQEHGAEHRRRWLERHRIHAISGPHIVGDAPLSILVMGIGQPPAPLPVFGIQPEEVRRLPNAPFNSDLMQGDVALVEHIRARSVQLGRLCTVESGLVAYGPGGSTDRMVYDAPGEGRVPFADASEFFSEQFSYLEYHPGKLHKAKRRELFEQPKIVVEIARESGAIRAAIDRRSVFVDHSCALVLERPGGLPLARVLELLRSPLVAAVALIEQGEHRDMYPRELARLPVPRRWVQGEDIPLVEAWELSPADRERLVRLAQ